MAGAGTIGVEEQAVVAMRYLAEQCSSRALIHGLLVHDLERWDGMGEHERRHAFMRAVRRVSAVCPWVREKGRVQDAADALGVAV